MRWSDEISSPELCKLALNQPPERVTYNSETYCSHTCQAGAHVCVLARQAVRASFT